MKKRNGVILSGCIAFAMMACNGGAPSGAALQDTGSANTVQEFPANWPVTGQVDSTKAGTPYSDSTAVVNKDAKKYVNDKGAVVTAVYHDSGDMGVAELNINGTTVKLMKDAKKDDAVTYTNGKITWKVSEQAASLEKDNVVTNYKEAH
ncbi:MAG TPA: cytochrome c class I [Niabella sp.]